MTKLDKIHSLVHLQEIINMLYFTSGVYCVILGPSEDTINNIDGLQSMLEYDLKIMPVLYGWWTTFDVGVK